ncbi:MAG: 30S ribosomal protein S27e [Candidatus Heimdallarchaeota archaeon LC_2]|nr:MAG: 30S ribosomal protein S27e [Candidatus Heimdallarchaeota archaeon LC_2]
MDLISQPNSNFVKVKCNECSTETIVFNHAKTIVVCSADDCSEVLAQPASGKAVINGEIIEVLN